MISISWSRFLRFAYIFAIMLMLVGLSFSKIFLSIGQFIMAGCWIAERFDHRRWLKKLQEWPVGIAVVLALPTALFYILAGIAGGFRSFFRNRPALIISSLLLLHLIGLFWTSDFGYALKDLRTKLPLFLLPLFFSTSETFGRKGFYRLILFFVLAVLVRSVYNFWIIESHNLLDIREVSRNISHIIFSLELSLGIFVLIFFLVKRPLLHLWQKAAIFPVLAWFILYIILSQSITGVSITLLTLLVLIPILIFRVRRLYLKLSLLLGVLVISAGSFLFLRSIVRDYYHVNPIDFTRLEKTTSRGNPYINNTYAKETDNGNYLWIYIQWDELRSSWNRRSRIPFDSLNLKSEPIAFTVIRYLNSKGWRKDADALERLRPEEIRAIEKGVANYLFLKGYGIRGRIYEFLWGFDSYRETGNPTGSSVMQRLEFWKASLGIIHDNWLTGVGTGDMNLAFRAQYEKMHTKLAPDQRWRSHDQFLSIFIGFGIFGLAWFLLAIFSPPAIMHRYSDYFVLIFLIIAVLSMLTGDTIETQTGVTFFALFYSLLLFGRKEKDSLLSGIQNRQADAADSRG